MPSPTRLPRGSPPKRAALHEKSDSQINERSLRMVGEPQAPIYSSPYPTKSSQIFSPKEQHIQGCPTRPGPGVSDDPTPSHETYQYLGGPSSLSMSQVEERNVGTKQPEHAAYRSQFSLDGPPSTPQMASSGTDIGTPYSAYDQPAEDLGRMSDDIVQLPSVPSRMETWVPHVSTSPSSLERQPVHTKDSESSLSSTNSTGTVIVKKNPDGKKRASYSAFPNMVHPSPSRSNVSSPIQQASPSQEPSEPPSPNSSSSPSPLALPSLAVLVDRRIPSSTLYANSAAASRSSLDLQYPVIRPPTASASWAEPPASVPQRVQQPLERKPDRWNPHLSTVQSEGTESQSEGRSSRSTWLLDSSRVSKSSSMALNGRVSSDLPFGKTPDLTSSQGPRHAHQRDSTGSTIRVVTEQEDAAPKLQPIPGSRGSEFVGVRTSVGGNRNSVIARPGSKASFFRDSIPAWARAYYARPPSSSSLSRSGHNSHPSTSSDNVSIGMFRPRTRHNREANAQPRRSSLAIEPVILRDLNHVEVRGSPRRRTSSNWSPHLWHDRTSLGRKRTIFQAPSIDEDAEGKAPSKRNAQIVLFVIGFIFPPAWFIACFLPLPAKPELPSVRAQNDLRRTQLVEDLEKQLGPIDQARYENARWWRNINRIMSLAGIVIVVAIITIAAVTAT